MILHCHISTKQDSTLYTQCQFRDGSNNTLELLSVVKVYKKKLFLTFRLEKAQGDRV
jgi:hypothetical protein